MASKSRRPRKTYEQIHEEKRRRALADLVGVAEDGSAYENGLSRDHYDAGRAEILAKGEDSEAYRRLFGARRKGPPLANALSWDGWLALTLCVLFLGGIIVSALT